MTAVDLGDYEKLMEQKPNLSQYTKKGYLGHYRTLTRALEKPIRNSSQNQILSVVKEISEKAGTQNALINMGILIFQIHNKDWSKLKQARQDNVVNIDRERVKVNNSKVKYLPNRQALLYHLEDLYKQGKWDEYIINYLLIYYNVRNQDLDVLIVDKVSDATQGKKGSKSFKKDNFLVIRKRDVYYIRSKYKTYNVYGTKSNSIQSNKFRRALLEYVKQQQEDLPIPLLIKANGNRLADGYIHKYISSKTLDNLSETDYMKIIVNYIDEKGSIQNLNTLSNNRGTSVPTLINNYNLKFQVPADAIKNEMEDS